MTTVHPARRVDDFGIAIQSFRCRYRRAVYGIARKEQRALYCGSNNDFLITYAFFALNDLEMIASKFRAHQVLAVHPAEGQYRLR